MNKHKKTIYLNCPECGVTYPDNPHSECPFCYTPAFLNWAEWWRSHYQQFKSLGNDGWQRKKYPGH